MSAEAAAISARDFGARGDGRHDDTAPIQQALDAAAETRGTVFLPPGIYACSTLHMRPHTGLTGLPTWTYREHGGTILRLADPDARCLVDITGALGATLNGLCLDGAGLGKDVHGVLLDKPDYGESEDAFRIERCRVGNFTGDGVRLVRAWCFSVRHSMLGYNRGDGLWLKGWDGFVLDNWFSCNGGAGFHAPEENSMTILTGNRVEYNKRGALILHGAKNHNINGNCFDPCGGPGVALLPRGDVPSRNVTITGNLFHGSAAANWHPVDDADNCHLRLEQAEGITVVGNSLTMKEHAGRWSPRAGIRYRALSSSILKDNAIRNGAMEALLEDLGGHGEDVIVKDNVGTLGPPDRG